MAFVWPDAEKLVAAIHKDGINATARAIGKGESTLRSHLKRKGIEYQLPPEVVELGDVENVPEVERLRERNRELEANARKGRKEDARDAILLQRFEEALTNIKPRYSPLAIPKKRKAEEHEFALLFSDTHAAEVVSEEEMLGVGIYDWDIMLRRMEKIRHAVLSYQEHRPFPIRKLHIWMLGDMLSGDIHDELTETNDRNAAEACVDFGVDTAKWLEEFVPHFEEIHVAGVPGNHPRRNRKPQAKGAHNNGDWLAYKFMETYHRNHPSISFNFKRGGFNLVTVAERWRCLLMHGDGIRSSMPGVPMGGVTKRVVTLEQQFSKARQPIDYVTLGHFHSDNNLSGVHARSFINGSVKGPDEYSIKQFGSGRAPAQLLLTFHPRHGWTDESLINCEQHEPADTNAPQLRTVAA